MTPTQKSTFDFGNGPVPAHQHSNGGGWVADTAKLSETAYVGLNAQVGGNARVAGNACVTGSAQVGGGEWAESPPQMQVGRWYACMHSKEIIAIGCQKIEIAKAGPAWIKKLAKDFGATASEVRAAHVFVQWCKSEMEHAK